MGWSLHRAFEEELRRHWRGATPAYATFALRGQDSAPTNSSRGKLFPHQRARKCVRVKSPIWVQNPEVSNDVKSGSNKLETFEMGPMDVKVIGTIAIVQGSDTEKSSYKEKTPAANGYGWMFSRIGKASGERRVLRPRSSSNLFS